MKLKAHEVDRYLERPDPKIKAFLFYGPDGGLVRERARHLTRRHLGPGDDMGLVELSDTDLKSDPARLADEVSAISMLADARVVRIAGAGDAAARAIEALLAGFGDGSVVPEALVIVQAGDLAPSAKLRKLFENAKEAMALPCYGDEGRGLQEIISETFDKANLRAEPAAFSLLMERLGQDRALTRGELEKLLLLKGHGREGFTGGTVTAQDVEASLGLAEDANMDRVIDAALSGNFNELDKALTSAFAAGANAIQLLRALNNHLDRLYVVRAKRDTGGDIRSAMKSLRPPVFFKREKAFQAQVSVWTASTLQHAMQMTLQAEIDCKRTGSSDEIICAHTLMALASNAARRR
ncbi:MAG: DNA polymerase III subunit delta [Alphaproteobacteria bacterium]|nr:MAG: DNA polymerase III subunit delta [Alphaproteobacteria bacterium]